MAEPLDDDELLAHVEKEEANCVVHYTGLLSEQRRKAIAYYYGEPYGNEVEGRSQVVTTEVKDAVEGIMPSMMAIFTSGGDIVRFEAQRPEDEDAAQQATDYCNWVFMQQNEGFLPLYCMIKDALLLKNGYVKIYWENYKDVEKETYQGLTDLEMHSLLDDGDLEVVEHKDYPDEDALKQMAQAQGQQLPQMPTPMLHDAVFRRTKKHGKVCIDPLPPEEVLVSREALNDLRSARFVEHRTLKTLSEIREMGYDVEDDIADYAPNADFNLERVERLKFDDALAYRQDSDTPDPSMKKVWLCEAYLKVDYDGDGIAELRKITKVGKTLLDNVEFDSLPIISGTAILMPHKHYGLSIYDLVGDLQLQKSTVLRQLFDNAYVANNGRMEVLDGMVNMSDLLTSRPNGLVRVKAMGSVKRIDSPLLGAPFYSLLDYLDKVKINRVGARDFGDAVDPDALNAKAHTAELVSNAAQERINLMARILAETAIKQIFWKILELVSKHQDKAQMVKLRGKWVQVSPREWKDKFHMTVSVGIGTGSQQAVLNGAMGILNIQQGMLAAGLGGMVVNAENAYNAGHKYAKAVFPKDADLFFTDPKNVPPQPPKPDPKMMKLQLQKEKQDAANHLKEVKMQMDAALDMRDKQFNAALAQHAGAISRIEEERKHETDLQKTAMQVSGEQQMAVIQGMIQSFIEEQKHHQTKVEQMVQGAIDLKVAKAKPKPKPTAP